MLRPTTSKRGALCAPARIRIRLSLVSLLVGFALGCSGSSNGEPPGSAAAGRGIGGNGSDLGGSINGTGGNGYGVGGGSAAGGAASAGGTQASGGLLATGGNASAGGSSAAGGTPTTGGALATGGSRPTGGAPAAGGAASSGGSQATGGVAATAGSKATGGVAATGGSKATGGVAATGGSQATGGVAATGGSKATGGTTGTGGSAQKCSVYIAGDSTVSVYTLDPNNPKSQAGWGQMLQQYYDSGHVSVVDKAVGGMTARHFIQAGNLDAILAVIKAGDYFLVQFGTNDSNTTATYTLNGVTYPYFADANTDFKTYLQQYIDGAKAKNATPVLVTPPPRNSAYCGGGRSMANYAQAMIDLGTADAVAVVDLSMKTWTYLNTICPKPADGTTENFFKVNADNTIDGTHFQENGATIMAGFVADGLGQAGLALDSYRIK